jgi:ABC-type sugar transport system ATPase subunit
MKSDSKKIENKVLLKCEDISKSFFGNEVLHNINLECRVGEILALIGENGAGKSTLINIISGNLQADKGTIFYSGIPKKMLSPHQAKEEGIVVVHQQLSLIPELSVAENLFLGQESKFGKLFIRNKELHSIAQKKIDENVKFTLDVHKTVSSLSPAERQIVEILKAWLNNPKLMILDEPTSSLSIEEVNHLFSLLLKLKERGASVIFITHRLDELFVISDKVVVLKDGCITKKASVKDVKKDELISAMVGRKLSSEIFPARPSQTSNKIVLKINDGTIKEKKVRNINFFLHEGEIVGIAGLEGQGQRDLARALFGIEKFSSGQVEVLGEKVNLLSPAYAMKHKIAFIPDDRDLEGIVKPMAVADNLILATLKQISLIGIVKNSKKTESVEKGMKQLSIKADSPKVKIEHLSGGNQQKVIFSKWVKTQPMFLILHEPTRGIDIETKEEIYKLLRRLANEGISILIVSSDMIELIGISDRIIVMYEGEIVGELPGKDATEEKIMTLSSGETIAHES